MCPFLWGYFSAKKPGSLREYGLGAGGGCTPSRLASVVFCLVVLLGKSGWDGGYRDGSRNLHKFFLPPLQNIRRAYTIPIALLEHEP